MENNRTQAPDMRNEADIGSGERKQADIDTQREIEKVPDTTGDVWAQQQRQEGIADAEQPLREERNRVREQNEHKGAPDSLVDDQNPLPKGN